MVFDFDVGQVIGAGISAVGQHSANKMNREMSRENMAWQEGLSNTSYQRSIADMKKAGLNPLYWLKGGGASTPQGQMAEQKNPLEGAKSFTSLAAARLKADIANVVASTNKSNKEADTAEQLAKLYNAQAVTQSSANVNNLLNADKLRYEMSKYKNADEFASSPFGSFMQKLGMTFDEVGKVFNSVSKLYKPSVNVNKTTNVNNKDSNARLWRTDPETGEIVPF